MGNMKRTTVLSGAGLIAALIVALGASPANAQATGLGSDSSSSSTSSKPFDSAQRTMGLSSDNATKLDAGLSVSTTSNSATTKLGDLSIKVTAQSARSDTTIVSGGARVMSLVENGDSSARFAIDLPANTALVQSGDGYSIVGSAGEARITLGQIHSPWAVDAVGKKLPTSYTLEGSTLIQHVVTDGATYPIVADPLITVGWGPEGPGTYLNITGLNAKLVSAAVAAVFGLTVAGGCVAAGKIPRVGFILQGICGFVGIPSLQTVVASISSILNSTALANNSCYSLLLLSGSRFYKVDMGYCQ